MESKVNANVQQDKANAERKKMEQFVTLLELIRSKELAKGLLRGCLHVLIGRTIKSQNGEIVSIGMTWRDLSLLLKQAKFDKEAVRELGADPETISPRDREKFWYSAIALAKPDSIEAIADAEKFTRVLQQNGYIVGPIPTGLANMKDDADKRLKAGKAK